MTNEKKYLEMIAHLRLQDRELRENTKDPTKLLARASVTISKQVRRTRH